MLKVFSCICAIITIFMVILHFLLFIGIPIGEYVLGGKDRIVPLKKRWINIILICIFSFLGLFYLGKGNIIYFSFPVLPSKIIMIIYSLFLVYAIIGNTFFTQSKKEKSLMIPLSIIGFISSLLTLLISW